MTKAQVGLGSVDDTPDVAKPISTATQAALDALTPLDDIRAYKIPGAATDDASIVAMYSARGYVKIPAGACNITGPITVDGDVYFDDGAYLTGSGILTFRDVYAPRDHIFRGAAPLASAGAYFKEPVYPEWWGGSGAGTVDVGAVMAVIATSMAARTEATIEFGEGGVYLVQSPSVIPRGWYIRFPGDTRRGIFKIDVAALAGADVFTSVDDALRMEGVQIELSAGTYYPGRLIVSTGANAKIIDLAIPAARMGIAAFGASAEVHDVDATGSPTENGFAVVGVGNTGSKVTGISGPKAAGAYTGTIVSIGAGLTAGSISAPTVENILGTGVGGNTVVVEAAGTLYIASGTLRNIVDRDGGNPIKFQNTGSSQIQYFMVDGLHTGSGDAGAYGVEIVAAGNINNITVGSIDMRAGAYSVYVSDASHLGLLDLVGPFHGATARFGAATTPANYTLRGRRSIGLAEPNSLSGNLDRTLDPLTFPGTIVLTGALTANRTITLPTVCPWVRSEARMRIVNTTTGAYTISVGGLAVLPPGSWVDLQWVGSAWIVVASPTVVDVVAQVLTTLSSLPTTDPAVAGQAWINGGVVCISLGA